VALTPLDIGNASENKEFLGLKAGFSLLDAGSGNPKVDSNLAQIDVGPPSPTLSRDYLEVGQKSFCRPSKWIFPVRASLDGDNPTE